MNVLELESLIKDPVFVKPRGVMIHVASKLNAETIARAIAFKNNIDFNVGIIAIAYGEFNY